MLLVMPEPVVCLCEAFYPEVLCVATLSKPVLLMQAVIIQLVCMVYEFYLLQRCNVSHLRMFSVFLALPSATVRLMAQRQLQVGPLGRLCNIAWTAT